MQINKVEICGVNTSELPVLKNNQMTELLYKIKDGDEEARQQFVRGNLRLVLSVIQKFNNRGENIDDLFQIGCIGLIKAIDNFDLSQNVRFSTYAVPMIIGEIRRYLRDNNPIRVSRSLKDIAYKALQVRERLVRLNAKEPTVSEISKELELPVEDVVMALDRLSDREKQIMELRFGLTNRGRERTQKEVATMLGISQSYISRLEKKIISRLKKEMKKFI